MVRRKSLRTRNAGVSKASPVVSTKAASKRGRKGYAAVASAVFETEEFQTPVKSSSRPLTLVKGSTPLRVYSPRRQKQLKSPGPKAKRTSSGKVKAQASKSPVEKKKVRINESPSSQGNTVNFPQYDQYVSEMKAYFADVDAYELKEEA